MGATFMLGALLLIGLAVTDVGGLSHMTQRDVITFFTGQYHDNTRFILDVPDRTFLTFRVRACQGARIMLEAVIVQVPTQWNLLPSTQDSSVRVTEIIIGDENNMKTTVRVVNGDEKGSAKTPQILDCNDYRQFWVSWGNDILQFGLGPIYEQQEILRLTNLKADLDGVTLVFFSTANNQTGMWQIEEDSGLASMVRTDPSSLFSRVWRSVEFRSGWISFHLKANNNARIALGAKSGVADYIIIIGGNQNTKHSIVKNGETVKEEVKKDLLDPEAFRPFWVKWENGEIKVGQGSEIDNLVIVTYTDSDYKDVGHVGFGTDKGSSGEWIFKETDENEIELSSPMVGEEDESPLYISAPHTDYVPFYVRACSDALITFTVQEDGADDFSIKVILGADDNTKIRIDTGFTPNVKVVDRKNLLSCDNYVPLWASWKLGPLTIGLGSFRMQDIVITYDDPIVPHIHTASFGNAKKGVKAYYLIDGSVGDELGTTMPPYTDFGKFYLTTRQKYLLTFTVQTKGGLQIMLTQWANSDQTGRVRVVFDMIGSSIALRRDSDTDKVGYLKTPLDADTPRPFWLSWHDDLVEVGEGHRYGVRTVVKGTKVIGYEVKVVSLSTDQNMAEVKMDMESDDLLSIKLPAGTVQDGRWFRLFENSEWLYLRLANSGVGRVGLSTWYRDLTALRFVLSFGEDGKNTCVLRGQNRNWIASSSIEGTWNKQDLRDFWISWDGASLSVGPSRYKGFSPFFTVPFTDDLRAVVFYPEEGSDVEWVLRHAFGSEATVFSGAFTENDTWVKVVDRNSFVFGVEACEEATVHLTDSMYTTDSDDYVVRIGEEGNAMTSLTAQGHKQMWTDSPEILNCTEERYFWITWFEGDISVGTGQQVGENRLLAWHTLTPRWVKAISVSSQNVTSMWRLGFLGGSLDPRPIDPGNGGNDSGLSGGAIAGIVIGCLLLVFIGVSVAFVLVRGVPPSVQRFLPSRHGDTRGLTGAGDAAPEPQYGDS